MRNATRFVATALGITAGLAVLEHGYFELLQGNVPPASLTFASMGPPCRYQSTLHLHLIISTRILLLRPRHRANELFLNST